MPIDTRSQASVTKTTHGSDKADSPPNRPPRKGHASGNAANAATPLVPCADTPTAIASMLQTFMSTFLTQFEQLATKISDRLSSIEDRFESKIMCYEMENAKLKSDLDAHKQVIDDLKDRLDSHDRKLKEAESSDNDQEQYSRKSSIRIFGLPPGTPKENAKDIVCKFVNDKLQLDPPLLPSSIDVAHRVGGITAKNSQTMLCKFLIRTEKMRVIENRTKLARPVRTGYGISDDITKRNLDFMKDLEKREDIKDVWFFNGKVFFKLKTSNKKFTPRLSSNIDKLIQNK